MAIYPVPRGDEAGNVGDPAGLRLVRYGPVALRARTAVWKRLVRMEGNPSRGVVPLGVKAGGGGSGRAPAGYDGYEYPEKDRPKGQDSIPSPLSCSP